MIAGRRTRWLVAVLALVASGCATLTEVSAPGGDNPAGFSVDQFLKTGTTLSGDGRFSVFSGPRSAAEPSVFEAYRRDNATGTVVRVSSDSSGAPVGGRAYAVSHNGRYVLFLTTAALVADDTNLDTSKGWYGSDYYVRDMNSASVQRVSVDATGAQIPSGGTHGVGAPAFLSADGRYVAFQVTSNSGRTYFNDVFVRDRQAAASVSLGSGYEDLSGMSGDGLQVAIDDHTACGTICPPPESGERIINWKAATTFPVGCGAGGPLAMSDDGQRFAVAQFNAVGCQDGIVWYDRKNSTSASVSPTLTPSAPVPSWPSMSADGTRVAFLTERQLVPEDINGRFDVYVKNLTTTTLGLASRSATNAISDGSSGFPSISADGQYVQFSTDATNLLPADTDARSDTVLVNAVRPTVTQLAPTHLARGSVNVTVTVTGTDFASNATAFISGSGVTVTGVNVVNAQRVDLLVSVSGAAAVGKRDVVIFNPGAYGPASGWCFACLTVT